MFQLAVRLKSFKGYFYALFSVGRDAQPAELSSLKDVTSKWAEKTRGILIETINAQNAEKLRAQERKNFQLFSF